MSNVSYAFASDNAAGVHPAVMQSLVEASDGPAASNGEDGWTRRRRTSLGDPSVRNQRALRLDGHDRERPLTQSGCAVRR
jgi:hypothetical protein